VPGTALAPGVQPSGAQPAAATPGGPDNLSRQSTRNYEIDRTVAYTRQPAGRLQRLTVAVLVDDLIVPQKDGAVVQKPLSEEQLARITLLVKDAVGFDAARGDSVNVVNASFATGADQPADIVEEGIPLWRQPWLQELVKIIAGAAIVIVLLLAVVRPLARGLLGPVRFAPGTAPALPAAGGEAVATADEDTPRGAGQVSAIAYEQQLAQARSLVTQDPKRVARVVKTWVGQDE
ncbi:MAG TPA: flagellar M-ring protein FliF C-terminal domain-containing protein, partial [Steroidobacteraceae bacterium]|nr:flagellar M-ring protein FliF C-terminal domain-containing protein [Steroidobacteraceae bacterium]